MAQELVYFSKAFNFLSPVIVSKKLLACHTVKVSVQAPGDKHLTYSKPLFKSYKTLTCPFFKTEKIYSLLKHRKIVKNLSTQVV
jgi:hypothetical protein